MQPVAGLPGPTELDFSWHEIEHLLTVRWDTPQQCEEQATWLEQLGWRIQRQDPPLPTTDGSMAYALVLHPSREMSPGALRWRPAPQSDGLQELGLVPDDDWWRDDENN